MKTLKAFVALALTLSTQMGNQAHAMNKTEEISYGIHLFFDEKEFIDEVKIIYNISLSSVTGTMVVPNDFEGPLLDLQVTEETIRFDLLVPKNAARPKDLVFHYEGRFFDRSKKQMIGFVTIKGENDFVASFTGFQRP